jgi:hypothetical protein
MPFWINVREAEPEEEGSFCDRGSKFTYNNVDAFTKESIKRDAEERGEIVHQISSSNPGEPGDVDQRFNLLYLEEDEREEFHPRYHSPGRW